MEPYFIYVWVRTDIPLAQQLVQVGHACYDAGVSFGAVKCPVRVMDSPHMCLLQVPDQESLMDVAHKLKELSIIYDMFYEPDNEMGFSAICTRPIKGEDRKALRGYKLWE